MPGKTELVRVRRRVTGQKNGGEEPKAASAKGSNKENAQPASKHSSKKEENKSSSKKDDKKSNSKSTDKAADAKKAAEEPKTNGVKTQAAAQNPSDPIFTPEEDAKLLLMKSEGKTWPEIAAAIGKTKKQTTRRFGEIKPNDWKPQKGGKHGIDKAGVVDETAGKQVTKMDNKNNKVEERKSKSNAIERAKQEMTPSAAVLLGGQLEHQHQHAHAHRHEVRHDHHVHLHDAHPRHSAHDAHHTRHDSGHSRSRPRKSHHRPAASVTPSSRTAYTIKTMPSLAEDDLFSFGELQALSELIGKDVEGMWHRVSAAFFGMTGRRIAAEDIKEKFADLEVE